MASVSQHNMIIPAGQRMKQGAFMGIELTVVANLPKILYPFKSY